MRVLTAMARFRIVGLRRRDLEESGRNGGPMTGIFHARVILSFQQPTFQ